MSAQLQHLVVWFVMTVLVTLFTWLYLRERQRRVGLWVVGWVAVFIHFTAAMLGSFGWISPTLQLWLAYSTLIVAGTSFYLSVAKACVTARRRLVFIVFSVLPSVLYWTGLVFHVQHPWFYRCNLILAVTTSIGLGMKYYDRKRANIWFLSLPWIVPAVWVLYRAADKPQYGMDMLMAAFFATTGLLYFQHHGRFTPGVIVTSISFLAWGAVFPIAETVGGLHWGLPKDIALWDLPTYFVALGMILTLFENQAEIANSIAQRYRNLTEHLKLEIAERKRAEEAAKAASSAKSVFLATMSHEIRTPMNGILGITGLLLETQLSQQQRDDLNLVKNSAESLLQVINDVLDFSKIEAGRLECEHIGFDLQEMLGETMKSMSFRAQEKGLELICDVRAEVPSGVIGDPRRLRQVLVNLMGNALKFTPEGEIAITVEKELETDGHVVLHFTVADTGVGVPPEKREEIFQAFTQADSSTTRRFGGTGLGLTISARLVQMMGGKIWVGTAPRERGSVFHFTVRLGMLKEHVPKPAVAQRETLQGLPVLVVDDNSTNRHLLMELLSRWGMSPASVNSGGRALQLLRDQHASGTPFRLVLLDFHMPGMNGLATAEQIRQAPGSRRVPIVLLTSTADSGIAARCRDLHISTYLNKPILQAELRNAIGTALGAMAPPPPLAPAPAVVIPRSTPLRILLAEDNRVNQILAVRLLEKQGHAVTVANDGIEALARAQEGAFDLALIDLEMPRRNGFEVTAAIRQGENGKGRHLPIVAMTAHAMTGDQDCCLAAGMDAYISKPIDPKRLYDVIENVAIQCGL